MAAANSDEVRAEYFRTIAPRYSYLTGNTTRDHFALVLEQHDLGITSSSVIHDNAAGPGTATSVLVPWCAARGVAPARILVTDYTPEMVSAFEAHRTASLAAAGPVEAAAWARTESAVLDSQDTASRVPDGALTHVVDNFSASTLGSRAQQLRGLREARRSLSAAGPRGVAVYTNWRRFPVAELVARAQQLVRGHAWARDHPVPMNGGELMREGHLHDMLVEVGWAPGDIQTHTTESLVEEGSEDWEGMFECLLNSPPAMAGKRSMTDEEIARWPDAVRQAMREEKEQHGGIKMEAWVLIAKK